MADDANNMRIWDAVSATDPKHTKPVNQRGGFTAIAAHSQIMAATEVFGPVGIGWGYINGAPIVLDGLVSVPVTIWHGDRENTYGPVYGGAELRTSNGKLDSDCVKKAATDALTKGLSHLGFNADVFLGLFDDNKYVAKATAAALRKPFEEAVADFRAAKTKDELVKAGIRHADAISEMRDDWQQNAREEYGKCLNDFKEDPAAAEHVRAREAEFGMRDTLDEEEAGGFRSGEQYEDVA